jgi:hypothetical protein
METLNLNIYQSIFIELLFIAICIGSYWQSVQLGKKWGGSNGLKNAASTAIYKLHVANRKRVLSEVEEEVRKAAMYAQLFLNIAILFLILSIIWPIILLCI